MSDILTVAQSTFGRFARMKALYLILVLCIAEVAISSLYNELTMGLDKELMVDCSLAILTIVGLLTAIAVVFEKSRELQEKTAQFILTKPGGRSSFIWGKFFGIGFLAVLNIGIITAGSLWAYQVNYGEFNSAIINAAVLILGESLVLIGAGLVLSMFLSDTLAALATFAVFFLGHSLYMLPRWSEGAISNAIYYIFPSFYNLDIKTEIGSGLTVSSDYIGWGIAYAVLYALALSGLATLIFSRKDIS